MGRLRRLVLVGVLAVAAAAGCGEVMSTKQREMAALPPFVRAEHLCPAPGRKDVDAAAARKDLGSLLQHVRNGMIVRYSRPLAGEPGQTGGMTAGTQEMVYVLAEGDHLDHMVVGTVRVTDSRVMASDRMFFDFAELPDHPLEFAVKPENRYPATVLVKGVMSLTFTDPDQARCVADTLSFIRAAETQKLADGVAAFQGQAEQYRAMANKPPVSEAQRKYVVQADAMAQDKDYAKALDLYGKALAIDAVSYPAAYYNMALIAAQLGRYHGAIASMKKYQMLVSDPGEARSAQDKIYEWQAKTGE